MEFIAFVYVSLKSGYSDPEGEAAAQALRGLGYSIDNIKASKAYEITFKADNREAADSQIDEMCKRLLTNPTKDDYRIELREKE
jgi:phosphoribosylformylglycinamidine synthase